MVQGRCSFPLCVHLIICIKLLQKLQTGEGKSFGKGSQLGPADRAPLPAGGGCSATPAFRQKVLKTMKVDTHGHVFPARRRTAKPGRQALGVTAGASKRACKIKGALRGGMAFSSMKEALQTPCAPSGIIINILRYHSVQRFRGKRVGVSIKKAPSQKRLGQFKNSTAWRGEIPVTAWFV